MIKVSVLIPIYNEEATVLEILKRVRAQTVDGVVFEVVAIDDASKDGTRERLESRPDLYETLVIHERNGGKGAAVRSGLRAATGDYVLIQDADLEYDPSEFPSLLLPLLRFKADLVIGSRLLAPKFTRVHYLWHKLGNKIVTATFNVLFNKTFTDLYSGYLIFRRDLISADELRASGWEQQAEIVALVARRSRSHYEVAISYHGRTYEEGKKIRAYHALNVMWTIVTMRFR